MMLMLALVYILFIFSIKFINIYLLVFFEITIIPTLAIEKCISRLLNRRYIVSAKEKIDKYKGNKIIITGSYGKTSTKTLFNQILNIYSTAIATPKSYNTLLGVASFINNESINSYNNIILEYGASKRNDIKELLNISKPDIAVVTEIGYMHMNSFKTINNVIEEKMSLIENSEIAILNYDNRYIREYKKKNKIILSYGFDYGDFNAKNVVVGAFDFYYKNKFIHHFDTKLVGKHQILNLLAVLSYIYFLGYDLNVLQRALMLIKVEDKRLELKKYNNRIVLDDSFNSNYIGFKRALDVIRNYGCKRFLITPGIVELGKYEEEIYSKLSKHIIKNIDVVILVGRNMLKYLKNKGVDVYVESSFKNAYQRYLLLSKDKASVVLIENDLPDIYIKRGIL